MSFLYNDVTKSPQERCNDLLPRLSLEEKIGQMCQVSGQNDKIEYWLARHVGSALHTPLKEVIKFQKGSPKWLCDLYG